MNLEAVEQKCLSYLKQVSNPLVPLHVLVQHLAGDPACGDVQEDVLLAFLRKHELFRVMDGPALSGESEQLGGLAEAGMLRGPYVILDTRIPTPAELGARVSEELETMRNALATALDNARQSDDSERSDRILALLARLEKLQKKLGEAL